MFRTGGSERFPIYQSPDCIITVEPVVFPKRRPTPWYLRLDPDPYVFSVCHGLWVLGYLTVVFFLLGYTLKLDSMIEPLDQEYFLLQTSAKNSTTSPDDNFPYETYRILMKRWIFALVSLTLLTGPILMLFSLYILINVLINIVCYCTGEELGWL